MASLLKPASVRLRRRPHADVIQTEDTRAASARGGRIPA